MKKKLGIAGVVFGSLAYLYMIAGTLAGTGKGMTFSTFLLWSVLATITSLGKLRQGADARVSIIYGTGATITTVVLICKGRYGWTGLDTVVAILTVVCIVLWQTSGPRWALVMSVSAGGIASIPFIVTTWHAPASSPIIGNAGFLIANTLALIAAKAWTLEDRLYESVNVLLCVLLVVPWLIM